MLRWNIEGPGHAFDTRLEAAAAELGLRIVRTSLKSIPPNVHWHLTLPDRTGTLEGTWISAADQAWLSVRANRKGEWIEPMAMALISKLRRTQAQD